MQLQQELYVNKELQEKKTDYMSLISRYVHAWTATEI